MIFLRFARSVSYTHLDVYKRQAQRQAEARKAQAEADRFAKEQEAEGIRAVGEADVYKRQRIL